VRTNATRSRFIAPRYGPISRAARRVSPWMEFYSSGCRDLNSGPSVPQDTEICPGSPSGPLTPVDSGLRVCRVSLCPS